MESTSHSPWPNEARGAVAITFDNLGDSAEVDHGWPPKLNEAGQHVSLAAILDAAALLDEFDLPATFFIEGVNHELYPELIAKLTSPRREIAYHGWRHESWAQLTEAEEHGLLAQGAALRTGELPIRGFRPPGGRLRPAGTELLKRHGFTYCSPVGSGSGVIDDLAVLPFEWEAVDATFYMEEFASLREQLGLSSAPKTAAHLEAELESMLTRHLRDGSCMVTVFHPFLLTAEDRRQTLRSFFARVSRDEQIWCAGMGEISEWILTHRDRFPDPPQLLNESWS